MNSLPSERPAGTLRRRLLVLLLLPLIALLLVSVAIDYRIAFETAAEAYDHGLADDAVALASRIRFLDARLQVDLPAAVEEVLRTDHSDKEFLAIYGADGKLLAGDADLHPGPSSIVRNPVLDDTEFRGYKVRRASYRIATAAGQATVTVAETTRKRERTGSKILAGMVLPNVLLVLATLALVFLGVRNGLATLTQLSKEISRRAPHDLSPLPKGSVPAEAEPLIKAMDGLIDDLRSAATAQQVFLANAAHQLRTPLASLQTQLELHTQELPDAYKKRANRLLEATHRLSHLTHQLLALARSGSDANGSNDKRPVDLVKLLESNASSWFDLAQSHDIDLGFETEPATVIGTEWLLQEMLANLIENALQYTPAGGCVTARSGCDKLNHPFVEVEDNGPGIPAEDRERVFNRFYRSEGTPGPGSGLGLAIVKEVVERHGAKINLTDSASGRGTLFRVTFNST